MHRGILLLVVVFAFGQALLCVLVDNSSHVLYLCLSTVNLGFLLLGSLSVIVFSWDLPSIAYRCGIRDFSKE